VDIRYTRENILRGVIIYSVGDTIAALILHQFSLLRMVGIMFVGGTVYALEIPNYFRWIDKTVSSKKALFVPLQRTTLALLYFNPLWIARHLLFIKFFSGNWHEIQWALLSLGAWSFLANIPIAFIANYIIQNELPYKWRFFGSATFSSLMAIYYALSETLFL
jgi:hypothetical protein